MSARPIRIEWHGDLPVLRLNRPSRRNAVDRVTADAVRATDAELTASGHRVAVLAAEPPVFCAGSDFVALNEPLRSNPIVEMTDLLLASRVFWVAAVEGAAVGGGMAVLAACPHVVAGESTSFMLTERKLGLFPSGVLPYIEVVMGARAAFGPSLLAGPLGAEQAASAGLVDRIMPDGAVFGEALAIARSLAAEPDFADDARAAWQGLFQTDHAQQRRQRLFDLLPDYLPEVLSTSKETS